MSPGLLKNSWICQHKIVWRWPDFPGKHLVLVATNTACKCPEVSFKTLGFVASDTAGGDPTYNDKYQVLIATNTAWNRCEFPLKMARGVSLTNARKQTQTVVACLATPAHQTFAPPPCVSEVINISCERKMVHFVQRNPRNSYANLPTVPPACILIRP